MEISPTTQAVLLLVSPLMAGGKTEARLLLKPAEYTRLARSLRRLQCRPCDLLGPEAAGLLTALERDFDRQRLTRLLDRGIQLAMALERWQQRSIQALSRADDSYPQRLKKTLKHLSPSLLYVCGNVDLLAGGGLAVVGSRKAAPELLAYARNAGEMAATAACTIISGGAKGVDQASMQGATRAGGTVIGVMAHNLESVVLHRDNRNALLDETLLLCSPFDPSARFQAWQAMDRNKLIYALADAALVVQSDVGKGGTWSGAKEQIERLRCVPVYTRTAGPPSKGLQALQNLGAHRWPEPQDADAFRSAMEAAVQLEAPVVPQDSLFAPEDPKPHPLPRVPSPSEEFAWATALETKVEDLLLRLMERGPLPAKAVAALLQVGQRQATIWLAQLVQAGRLTKTSRPIRYQRALAVPDTEDIPSRADEYQGESGPTTDLAARQPTVADQDQNRAIPSPAASSESMWADELWETVAALLKGMLQEEPLPLKVVTAQLKTGPSQAETWLERLVQAGTLEKTSRPVRYRLPSTAQAAERSAGTVAARSTEPKQRMRSPQPHRKRPQPEVPSSSRPPVSGLAVELFGKVEELMHRLLEREALTVDTVATALDVSPIQASSWLGRLAESGKLVRTSPPVRYQWRPSEPQNPLL